jgi:hypothetical protein
MFERMEDRVRRRAREIARSRAEAVAKDLTERLPPGVEARIEDERIEMSGRGLFRRLALEPALRALLGRLR